MSAVLVPTGSGVPGVGRAAEAPVRILVVDPDPLAAQPVEEAVPGAVVWRVDDAYAALAYVETHAVDVLVTERLLPGADADDLLRRLEQRGHAVPVVICSHRRGPVDFHHGWVRAVFTKPVDPSALGSALTTVVVAA